MRATYIKNLENRMADQRLYRLSEPVAYDTLDENGEKTTEYVIVSAAVVLPSGAETYIFAADADGEIKSYLELDGSYRGGLDHNEALSRMGVDLVVDEGDDA